MHQIHLLRGYASQLLAHELDCLLPTVSHPIRVFPPNLPSLVCKRTAMTTHAIDT